VCWRADDAQDQCDGDEGKDDPTLHDAVLLVPFWESGTHHILGAYLAVQDDGNVVIYSPGEVVNAVWQTNTVQHHISHTTP